MKKKRKIKKKDCTDPAQNYYQKKNISEGIYKEIDSFAMWGFLLSWIPPLFFFAFPVLFITVPFFCLASMILSIFSLIRIKKNSSLKGKGFAIAGIAISLSILAIIMLLVFALGFFAFNIILNS